MDDGLLAALKAVLGLTTAPVGRYRYDPASDTWWWSDEMFGIHGFAVHEIVPTAALMLAHQHPNDRAGTVAAALDSLAAGRPVASRHRLVDTHQVERTVVSTAEAELAAGGEVIAVHGLVVDVTAELRRDLATSTHAAVAAVVESRGVIDQAKGALMLVYGMDEEAAFGLLRWYSQRSNVKLRVLAKRLVEVATHDMTITAGNRRRLDEVFYAVARGEGAASEGDRGAATGELSWRIDQEPDAVILTAEGEIDIASGPQFTAALAQAAGQARAPGAVVLDFTGLSYLGSVGVAVLAQYKGRCAAQGTPLRVVAHDTLRASGALRATGLPLFSGVDAARRG